MKPFAGKAGFTRWALLVSSVAIMMGHICVLPGHVHAEASVEHTDGHHSPDADESIHAASCEAVRSAWIGFPIVLAISSGAVTTPAGQAKVWITSSGRSPSVKSPPLFLLHSSFLI
jgi:hypothetical protein